MENTNGINKITTKILDTNKPKITVEIDGEIAWKIFTKSNNLNLENKVTIIGNEEIGKHVLSMICLMI